MCGLLSQSGRECGGGGALHRRKRSLSSSLISLLTFLLFLQITLGVGPRWFRPHKIKEIPSSASRLSSIHRKGSSSSSSASSTPAATAVAVAGHAGANPIISIVEEIASNFGLFVDVLAAKKDHLLAGAVARGVMISSLYPVDTVKTRVQMFGASEGLKRLNLKSLYAGMASSLLGQMPYGMLVYGSYEVFKDMLLESVPKLGKDAISLVAAVASDITGSIWLCPSEVIKQQMQSAAVGAKVTLGGAVGQCWKEGKMGGFYQGYGGLLLRDIPFRALQLPMYERTKLWLDKHLAPHAHRLPGNDYESWKEGLAGVISGSIASAITTPFDVVKTRLQVDPSYKGAWDCAVKVARKEGFKGLMSGVVPRVLYIGPSTALFFVAYGAVRNYICDHPMSATGAKSDFDKRFGAKQTTPPSSLAVPIPDVNPPSRGVLAHLRCIVMGNRGLGL